MTSPFCDGGPPPPPVPGWRLAPGVELLGAFKGSAFSEHPHLLRRGDGQIIQMSLLVYTVASCLDGEADATEIAEAVSTRVGRALSAENVSYLVANKLEPLGVVENTAAESQPPRSKPLLALRLRARVIPEPIHRRTTMLLRPLFHPAVILAVLAGLILTDLAVATTAHAGVSTATRTLASHPALLLLVTALVFASGAIHELGHATAARYGGATPGAMGIGVYLVWPVLFTDVSDVYRLGRGARLRTDLGGVYFNAIVMTAAGGAFLATHFTALLVFIVIGHVQALYQFLPFVRMDGYWVLSDLIGVPNLFAYIAPILSRMRGSGDPGTLARLTGIRPWARRVITGWVYFTVAILALNAVVIVKTGPRILRTDLYASRLRALSVAHAFARGEVVGGLNNLAAVVLLAVPVVGMVYIITRLSARTIRTVRKWWPNWPARSVGLSALGLLAVVAFAFGFVPREITPAAVGQPWGNVLGNPPG